MTITERKKYIRRTLTPMQKKREMVLVLLGVEKAEIADAIADGSRQLISNIFTDKHRSPSVEKAVVAYLNSRIEHVGDWEKRSLYDLAVVPKGKFRITVDSFGWPAP